MMASATQPDLFATEKEPDLFGADPVPAYRPDPDKVLEEPSLPKIANISFEGFDRQYHAHMQNLAEQIEK